MKKSSIFVFIVFGILLSMAFASAAESGSVSKMFNDFADGFVKSIEPLAKAIVGTSDTGEVFFGRLLMMIVVFTIVYVALYNLAFFDEATWAPWLIGATLAIVSVRFLTPEWIKTVVLPNQVFAVVLSAGLPFVLMFLLVKDWTSKTGRRAAWVFFGVVFLAMWSARAEELGSVAFVYPLTALAAAIMFMFDGTWRRWLAQIEIERLNAASNAAARTELQTKINEVRIRMSPPGANPMAGTMSQREGDRLLRDYEKRLKTILRQ